MHLPIEEEQDSFLFHRDILVDGCKIEQYNINTRVVRLSDNRHLSTADVINLTASSSDTPFDDSTFNKEVEQRCGL